MLNPELVIANPGPTRKFTRTYFVLDFSQTFVKFLWMILVDLNIIICQFVIEVNHPNRFFVTFSAEIRSILSLAEMNLAMIVFE